MIPVIYKGDDTDFNGGSPIILNIGTDFDLDGCRLELSFLGCRREFLGLSGRAAELSLVFSAQETGAMPLGTHRCTIRVWDPAGRVRTLSDSVRFKVTDSVDEAAGGSIDVEPGETVEELTEADGLGSVKEAVNKLARIVGAAATCLALTVGGATLNKLSGTNEVYTAAETDARIVELSTPTSLEPATNYTDRATNALAATMLSRAEFEAGYTDWTITPAKYGDADIVLLWKTTGDGFQYDGWVPYPAGSPMNIGRPMGTADSTNLVWRENEDAFMAVSATRTRLRPTSAMDVTRTTDTSVLLNDPALPSARLVPDETPSAYWPNRQRVLRLGDGDSVISMDRTETKLLLVDDPTHLVFVDSVTVDGNGNTNYTFKTFQQFLNAVSPDTLQQTLRSYLPTEGGGSVTGNVEMVGDLLVQGKFEAPNLVRVVTADIEANGFSVSNGVLRANSGLMVSNGMCRINCARAVLGIGTPRLHMETVDPLSHITFGGTWDQPYGNLTDAISITVQNNIVNAVPTFEQAQSYAYLPTNTPPFTTGTYLSQDVVSHTPPVGLVTLRNWKTNVLTDSQYNAYVVLQLDSNELPLDKFECDILFRYTSSVPSFYFHFGTFGDAPTFYGQTDAFSPTAGTVRLVHMKHIGNDEWIVTYQDLTSWSPPMNMTFPSEEP